MVARYHHTASVRRGSVPTRLPAPARESNAEHNRPHQKLCHSAHRRPECPPARQPNQKTFCSKGLRHLNTRTSIAKRIVNGEVTFLTCPLQQQAGGRRVSRRDSVLAGAGVVVSFASLFLPLLVAAEGFFIERSYSLSGDHRLR